MIPNEQVLVTISSKVTSKVSYEVYQSQNRGGKGKSLSIKDEDFVRYLYLANRHDCFVFTNKGRLSGSMYMRLP